MFVGKGENRGNILVAIVEGSVVWGVGGRLDSEVVTVGSMELRSVSCRFNIFISF